MFLTMVINAGTELVLENKKILTTYLRHIRARNRKTTTEDDPTGPKFYGQINTVLTSVKKLLVFVIVTI
jgi:hypothetical protein